MDYNKIAKQIIKYVGGKENIISVEHCATRLRFKLKNADLRDEDKISDIPEVKGTFMTTSQFQIILGSGLVNLVCAEVQKEMGNVVVEEVKNEKEGNAAQRFVKMFSDIFVPIIPAIVAGGLLMGINNVLTAGMFDNQSIIDLYPQFKGLATMINIFANAPFTFLPVLIGFSATKRFGGNPYLGAALGMIMVHPELLNAYALGTGVEIPSWNLFGLEVMAVGYQGTVLPVLAVSWILANIEKRLHKVTPTWLDNLTTPLIAILLTAFITFVFVGPVLRGAGDVLADGITWLYNSLGAFGGAVFGLLYAPITLTGMHHSFIPIETQLLAAAAVTGGSFIFITASMNNVAQGAAVIAVLLLTKNEKMKSICTASGVSAFLGITEPAMFGVTLKLRYPFYAAMIGSAVGSAYCALFKILAQALGAAGIPGFISVNPSDWMHFGIGLALSIITSFVMTVVFWKKKGIEKEEIKEVEETKEIEFMETEIYSPMNGKVSSITKSNDEAFSSKAMGDGIVVDPLDGNVYAPVDGFVKFVFPTKHALGFTTNTGLDIMIHCGINTVNLNGEGFEIFVEEGQKVSKGEKLLSYDLTFVESKGCDIQTMMAFTNAKDKEVSVLENENAVIADQIAIVK